MTTGFRRYGLCLVFAAFAAKAAPQYSCELIFAGYSGTVPLTNFPVLVRLAAGSPNGFSYSNLRPDGADLSFVDAEGNPIDCETETWNPSGESCVWVRIPQLTASTRIRMRWGDPEVTGPTAAQEKGGVWAPAAYAGVWHFAEDGGTAYDSTINALDAALGGAATEEMVVASNNVAAGYARTVSSTGKNNYFIAPTYNALALGSSFTVSGWFHGTPTSDGRIFRRKNAYGDPNGWEIQWKGTSVVQARGADGLNISTTLPASPVNDWMHLAFVYDGKTLDANGKCSVHIYCNGKWVADQSPTAPATDNNRALWFMGSKAFTGEIDEFRLQAGVASAAWIKAEYDTITSRSFYTASDTLNRLEPGRLGVIGTLGETVGAVSPAFGTHSLADGEAVAFSAPASEVRLADGRYLSYQGYRLYTIDAAGKTTLLADSDAVSGTYTHSAGTAAQLVWKQTVRRGGPVFATTHSSIVTVSGYTGGDAQTNFPVLFRLAEGSPEGFSYADTQAGGTDILFTTPAGAVLPHEVESWDPEGTSFVWVNLPRMELGTKFLFRYGNATATTRRNAAADVWADAGYAGVWHMAETDAASSAADSTGHGLHAVPGGTAPSEMVGTEGVVGGARVVASSAVINSFTAPRYDHLHIGGTFTIGGWFKATAITPNGRVFCHKKSYTDADGWEVQWSNNSASSPSVAPRGASSSSGVKSLGVSIAAGWAYLAWVYDGDSARTYANGRLVGENLIAPATDNFRALVFGSQQVYKGALDEIRLLPGAASASRLQADYQTVTKTDFLSAAAVTVSEGSDRLSVESAGEARGEPTPAYGSHTGLSGGQTVSFSAPAGEFAVDEDLHYRFGGWSLFVTDEDGVEAPPQVSASLSGTYTHVAGTNARLVWDVEDLYPVRVTAENGSVAGAGYHPLGSVTLTATPAQGYRIWEWVVDGVKSGRLSDSITVNVQGPVEVTAVFSPIPETVGLWTLCGREAGAEISSLANEAGNAFAGTASAVAATAGAGALPTCVDEGPSMVVYADATASTVLARRPKSIRFAPAAGFTTSQGGGEIDFAGLAEYIAGGDDVTIECFAKADSTAAYRALFSANLGNDAHCLFLPAETSASARFSCETSASGNKGDLARFLRSRVTEAWHHVAVVYKPSLGKARFYVDYVEASSMKAVSILGTGDWSGHAFRLGSSSRSSRYDHNYAGLVSCLRVTHGERDVSEFMVAAPRDPEDPGETLALFNPRGAAGEPASTFRNLAGDTRLAAVCMNAAGEITWSADVPGDAIFASAADLAAKKPLLRRPGALRFADTNTKTTSYVVLENFSQVLTGVGDFTVEFFVRNEGTNTWKTAFTANLTGQGADDAGATKVAVPGANLSLITLQQPTTLGCNMGYNMSGGGQWHHIAMAYVDATRMMLFYIDYTRRGSMFLDTKQPSPAPALLGVNYAHSESFVGKISAFRATRRALGPEEFLRAGPRPEPGLILFVK